MAKCAILNLEAFNGFDFTPRASTKPLSPEALARRSNPLPPPPTPSPYTYRQLDLIHPILGTTIAVHLYIPPSPRLSVVFMHGMGEYGPRYTHLYTLLTAAGVAVVAPDQAGCGYSEGAEGRVEDVREWVSVAKMCCNLRKELFGGDGWLMGHSLGGLTSFWTANIFPDTVTGGLILSAPALLINRTVLSAPLRSVLHALPRPLRRLHAPPLSESQLTLDPVPGLAPITHPLIAKGPLETTYAMACAGEQACRLIDHQYAKAAECRCRRRRDGSVECTCCQPATAKEWRAWQAGKALLPETTNAGEMFNVAPRLFVLTGSADALCEWHKAVKLVRAAGGPDFVISDMDEKVGLQMVQAENLGEAVRAVAIYKGLGHELFRETVWESIAKALIEFLNPQGEGASFDLEANLARLDLTK